MSFQRLIFHVNLQTKCVKCLFALLFACGIFFLEFQSSNLFAANVANDFKKALTFFERGQFGKSTQILKKIISRYPDHKASYFLLGRILYHSGKMKKAAKYFAKGGTAFLSGGAAFEYGISMFAANKCNKAIKGFSKLSSKSSFADIGYFYTAVCHIRAQRWYSADSFLRRAVRLPANLAQSRRNFQIELRKKLREQRSGRIPRSVPYSVVPAPSPQYPQYYQPYQKTPDHGPLVAKKKKKKKKPAPPPQPQLGLSFSFVPKIEYSSESVNNELHSRGLKDKTTTGPKGNFVAKVRYDIMADSAGKVTYVELPFDFELQDYDVKSNDSEYWTYTDEPENVYLDTETTEEKDKYAKYTVDPKITFPAVEMVSLEGGYKYSEKYPDMKGDEKSISMGPHGGVVFYIDSHSLKFNAAQTQAYDQYGELKNEDLTLSGEVGGSITEYSDYASSVKRVTTSEPDSGSLDGFESTLGFEASLTRNWDKFSITLLGKYMAKTPPADTYVSGASQEAVGGGSLTIPLKYGASLTGSAEFGEILEYYKTGLEVGSGDDEDGEELSLADDEEESALPADTVKGVGSRKKFSGTAKIAPLDWLYAQVTGSMTQWEYQLENPTEEQIEAFEKSTTSQSISVKYLIGVSYSF